MKRPVERAVEQIRATFEPSPLTICEDGEGGAVVIVETVPLGAPYDQENTWLGGHLTFQYPYSDVYPLFVRGDLSRSDSRSLGEALSPVTFKQRPAIQISRRSNHMNPATDTAVLKFLKVLEWLKARP